VPRTGVAARPVTAVHIELGALITASLRFCRGAAVDRSGAAAPPLVRAVRRCCPSRHFHVDRYVPAFPAALGGRKQHLIGSPRSCAASPSGTSRRFELRAAQRGRDATRATRQPWRSAHRHASRRFRLSPPRVLHHGRWDRPLRARSPPPPPSGRSSSKGGVRSIAIIDFAALREVTASVKLDTPALMSPSPVAIPITRIEPRKVPRHVYLRHVTAGPVSAMFPAAVYHCIHA
jgi:hypothetical protein